ncbi:hypothetical protein CW705_00870 [Candidatus Bathyarchaeota archaeon]|nr:MAG: hypothetical protein CW705_00870 [Candidatus Bathyarchaeota archaeon]
MKEKQNHYDGSMKYKILVLLGFLILLSSSANAVLGQEYYTYYGYIPSRMWYAEPKIATHGTYYRGVYTITNVQKNATLTIVGWYDNTQVEVYTLPNKTLVKTLTLNRMEKTHILLPNGTFFKLQTNRPVFALLTAGELNMSSPSGPLPIGFMPSIDGVAVGKEFIFMASQALDQIPYRFRALEDTEIKIVDETGTSVKNFKLAANSWKDLAFKSFKVYHVTSTGNIMIQTWDGVRTRYIPSVTGSYIGKAFYTESNTVWNPLIAHGFMIMALNEDAKVKIYDVEYQKKIYEATIPAGGSEYVKPETVRMRMGPPTEIFIESDKPIMVCYVHHGAEPGTSSHIGGGDYGTALTYLTVKPGQTTEVYVPVNCTAESYIFAYKETNIVLDGLQIKLDPDEYLPIQQGFHEISADAEIIIQITHWPNIPAAQGLYTFASIIPPSQSANIEKQINLKPIVSGGPPVMLYGGVAAAAVAAAAVAVFFVRSRRARS